LQSLRDDNDAVKYTADVMDELQWCCFAAISIDLCPSLYKKDVVCLRQGSYTGSQRWTAGAEGGGPQI